MTDDLGLVFAFEEDNLVRGVRALEALGFKAKIPVTAEAFAKKDNRKRWAAEKNMLVFQMALFEEDDLPVAVFVAPPFDMEAELACAHHYELAPGFEVPVVPVAQLIAMKQRAGRPRDLGDVADLKRLFNL